MNRIGTQGDDMYKDNRVSAVNFFRTAMKGEDENLVNPNLDSTALMIERGTKGAVIVNTNARLILKQILLTEHMLTVLTAKPNILLKTVGLPVIRISLKIQL